MISTRYAIPTVVLIAFALVPTTIHSYLGIRTTDALTTNVIAPELLGAVSQPTARRSQWVRETFQSTDWIERTYRVDGEEVVLFAGRSYDAKRLYHHPELGLLRGTTTVPVGIVHPLARPDIAVHLVSTALEGRHGLAAYALLYNGRFIENPVMFQLRTSAALVFSAPKPMTLFFASALTGDATSADAAPATRILLAAIHSFEMQSGKQRATGE
jgi:hypothetical protein